MSRVPKTPSRKVSPNTAKDPIEVFCRVRPLADDEESCVDVLNENVLQINAPKHVKFIQTRVEQVQCTFSKIFTPTITQRQIFEHVGLPLVQDLLAGKNGLCFMYGITGSGKTYTMNGEPRDGGVLPRCLDCIFNSINSLQTQRCMFKSDGYNGFSVVSEEDARCDAESKYAHIEALQKNEDIYDTPRIPDMTTLEVEEDNNYAIFVSFVEIYNNAVFDLLEDVELDVFKQPKPPGSKILREDQKRNMFVYEATELEVKKTEEAFTLFWMGQQRRKTAHTLLNTESSRSHCVFTIKLVQAPLGPNGERVMQDPNLICISQLSLCDLAGSERTSRTKAEGEKIRQAGHINNSLMTLRSCIEALRENQRSQEGAKMVPYRDSKLTHLFKNYFDGDGKVRMVVCLNPRADDFDESLHVMRFAELTQEVKVARSEGVKFDTGLAPGRGKAHKQFKITDEETSDTASVDALPPLQLFPPFPMLAMSGHSDTTTLSTLMHYLEDRTKLRQTLYHDWKHKQTEVRQMIVLLEQDNVDLTKAMEEQRVLISDKDREAKSYEKKIRVLNDKYETLQRSSQSFESNKRQLTAELEKQKENVHKERQEKSRLKQTLKDLTSNERLRWQKECDKRVYDKQMEMEGEVLMRNEKLRQLRDVVTNLQLPEENQHRLNQIISGGKDFTDNRCSIANSKTTTTTHQSTTGHNVNVRKDTTQGHKDINQGRKEVTQGYKDINQIRKELLQGHGEISQGHKENYRTDQIHHERIRKTEHTEQTTAMDGKHVSDKTKRPPSVHPKPRTRTITVTGSTPRKPKVRSKSPPPPASARKNDVAPVRGKHRRSRSSDFWLNHKPVDTLGTDTVMQPLMKNKKTVKTPNVKDLKTIPNYILTHQEEDSAGEIETKLIKGDVIRTRGGGTSVQFTDVETLKKTLQEKTNQKVQSKTPKSEKHSRPSKITKNPEKEKKSPTKKRKSADDDAAAAQCEDSWTSVETRCGHGIEGKPGAEPGIKHHPNKKLKS